MIFNYTLYIEVKVGGNLMTGMGPGPQNPGLLRIFSDKGELLYERLVYPNLGYGLKVSRGRTGEK